MDREIPQQTSRVRNQTRPHPEPQYRARSHPDSQYSSSENEEDDRRQNAYESIDRMKQYEEAFLRSVGLFDPTVAQQATVPVRNLSMNRSSVKNIAGSGGGKQSLPHMNPSTLRRETDRDFETSCLARTPSGSLFIPSDMPKRSGSPQHKNSAPSLHDDIKHPDRAPVPVIPVRNSVRRPVSSHFAHSRLHLRKTLSSRCSWKCTALIFIFISIALLTALSYFIVVNLRYANRQPCPVMVDDTDSVVQGPGLKSTYQDPKGKLWLFSSPQVRNIRDVTHERNSSEIKPGDTSVSATTDDLMDESSGDATLAKRIGSETSQNDYGLLDLRADELLSVTSNLPPSKDQSNTKNVNNNDDSQPAPANMEVSASKALQHDAAANPRAVNSDYNASGNQIQTVLKNPDAIKTLTFPSDPVEPKKSDFSANLIELPEHEHAQAVGSGKLPLFIIRNSKSTQQFGVKSSSGSISYTPKTVTKPEELDSKPLPVSSTPLTAAQTTKTEEDVPSFSTSYVDIRQETTQLPFIKSTEKAPVYYTVECCPCPKPLANTEKSEQTETITEPSSLQEILIISEESDSELNYTELSKSITPLHVPFVLDTTNASLPEEVAIFNSTDILKHQNNSIPKFESLGNNISISETPLPKPEMLLFAILNYSIESNTETTLNTIANASEVIDSATFIARTDIDAENRTTEISEAITLPIEMKTTTERIAVKAVKEVTPTSFGISPSPAKIIPPESDTFSEVRLGRRNTRKVTSFGHWNVQFHQREAALVKFNFSVPAGASIGVYGRRNSVPSHTRYDFVEILSPKSRRVERSLKEAYNMEFIHFLDPGLWYISVYNDGENPEVLSFVPVITDQSSLPCPYDCHGHGTCDMGTCACEPDYAGDSCAYRVCPVLCSGRGQYVSGECVCNPGWKGKECQLREDECEVADCSGHGDCADGTCRCFPGYKGDYCEEIDCLDPDCSGHGVCVSGMCLCRKGWKGADCNEPDSDALRCLPDCSEHGQFDLELQRCVCDDQWTGPDCSQEKCDLDCGPNGRCQDRQCVCLEGWSGTKCMDKLCDLRCAEHGQCKNGTCLCIQGWNGRHCTLEGCPKSCNSHGECVMVGGEWQCRCEYDWDGVDCNVPLERVCDDSKDNDNDGLVDCADSECCRSKDCKDNPLCFSATDPLDILLRKQPPAVTSSFFQRMQFLIEEDSVQSYAREDAFNDSRASVIRGQVVSLSGSGLRGIRVGISTDPLIGFTVTRETGWFDLMVNGGGAVTLQFQREPFKPHERIVVVPWNEIVVMNKVIMTIREENTVDYKSSLCLDHNYDTMKPVVLATWKHGFQGGCPEKSSILTESQVVQESLSIPGTDLHLVYHSSRMGGYLSTIQLQLTPDEIPPTLRLIHLRISIEGILFEKQFEADPGIKFTYAWNRRNVYRQRVYGVATATVHIGYEYSICPQIIWEVQNTQVSGHDMSISEIGGWNLDIHHRYNFHEGILQKGDGTNIYLKNKPKVLLNIMGDGQQRLLHCPDCNGIAKKQRLLAPVTVTGAPDGSIFVGDFNLIRRITPNGLVTTVVELSDAQVAYRYHLAVAPVDGKLYISDPERHQVLRAISLKDIEDVSNNIEVVVGSGLKCLPGDKLLCGDGRSARDAKLSYPKGIAISAHNEMYIADGTNIRLVDKAGIIHTLVGDHYHKSHWKPIPCSGTVKLNQVNLRWPTELSLNPLDSSLHILDDHMVLKITQDKRLKVVAGRPLHCPSPTPFRERSDVATEIYLESPQGIAFAPNGDLYIAESDSLMINRVRVVGSDGRISHFAGAESKCSCLDVNCKCFDEYHFLATTSKFNTISSIAVTPDGVLHISDQGNQRIRSVSASLPQPNNFQEYEIYYPQTQEIYFFNRHGQHIATKNILTGKTVYTFSYNVNTSFGKLSTVTDAAGNKIYILRDYSNQVNTIENTQGGKCRLEMSRMRMLESFTTPDNFKTMFDYHGSTGLLTSKIDSSGRSYIYNYDDYGRLTEAVTPSGENIKLSYNLSIKGASVTVIRDDMDPVSLIIKGSDVVTKIGDTGYRIIQHPDGSLMMMSKDSSTTEIETVPHPVLSEKSPLLAEIFPVPARLKTSLRDDLFQRFEWRYYLRREGKGWDRKIMQIGRKIKVNDETLLSVEFDREQYSETVYDKKQVPLVTVHYDTLGHPLQWMPTPNITAVQLEYDRFGRLSHWKRGYLSERYSFDIQGRLAEVRYSDNSGIMYKYDEGPISLPTEIILPSGSRYLLQYDSSGSLQAVITPNGHKHEIAKQTSLGFYKLLYVAPGVKHPYVLHFNHRGDIIAKLYPKTKGRVVYNYDKQGKLETVFCGSERTDYHYIKETGQVKNIVKSVNDLDYRVEYRYHGSVVKDEKHRYSSRSELDGAKIKYRYDGRLSSVQVEINGKTKTETNYRYNSETGLLEQVEHFLVHRPKINSIFIQDDTRHNSKTIGIDPYGRIAMLAMTLWNKEVFSLTLLYDNRSRIKQTQSKIGKDGSFIVTNYTYTMDGFLERISGSQTWRFIYDINGNMKSVWEGLRQISLRYDDGDRLIGYGDVELYVVDARGFVVQRGEEKFQFNAKGQLTLAFELHQYEVKYFYDANDRLIARKDHRGNITQFLYADPKYSHLITHVHYPKSDLTFVLIYDTNNHLIYMKQEKTKYYVATDHIGTPVAVLTPEGNIIKEIYRTPFGKVLTDSNPEFFLAVDFHGGIRDPLTQLIHFGSRVYDPLGAQWLTPSWEDIPSLLRKPYNIHLYRFHNNDPINPIPKQETHLNELPEWLTALGYDMSKILFKTNPCIKNSGSLMLQQSLPVISGLSCTAEIVTDEFYRFSTVPQTEVKVDGNFLRRINSRIANLPSVLGDGILLSRQNDRAIVQVVSEASPILRDVVNSVFNDTFMIDFHFSHHGQDSFYFVQPDFSKAQEDWDQLQRLGSMFNVTMHPVKESESLPGVPKVDIRVQSTSVLLNMRYGTSLQEEILRLVVDARRRAVEEAWQQEVALAQSGHRGSRDWSKGEREELLSTGAVPRYYGNDVHDTDRYPQLADDPTNVVFQKENSRKRRARLRRRPG
ncbi:teneurin transmembrane protein Ten-m isoform X2 [Tachypleus tridentatus]|uniref:teneurin transmembrane protein Ten-m isoform X2 n=2 Tax=Tachypleus tridentatus TaxID=6853 RepID=UPI003FD07554